MPRSRQKIRLEDLLTSPNGFGLATATPVQRAVCRVVDGEPLGSLAKHPEVIQAFGTDDINLKGPPFEIAIVAAIRGGKSKFAACLAVRNALTVDLSKVTSGDEVRSSIVSVKLDLASPILSHVKGALLSSRVLKANMIGDPTSEGVDLRHPSGRAVEIRITSGSRAGSSLVARYSAGCVFDEACRMQGQEDGVVNLDHLREAVIGRLVDGAQLVHVSSPWSPTGPIYDMTQEHFGKPTQDLVVIRANGSMLNPVYWTPKRIADLKRRNPRAYKTDYLAEFADLETSLFTADIVNACSSRTEMVIPPDGMQEYGAACDPATKRNAWTFVIVTRKGGKKIVVYANQWIPKPGEPLNTSEVIREMAAKCREYRVPVVKTDQYASDFVRDKANEFGLDIIAEPWTQLNKTKTFDSLEKEMQAGLVDLPPDPYIRQDLQLTKRRMASGGPTIVFGRTKDGRHCDYSPAIAMALRQYLEEPVPAGPEPGSTEYHEAEALKAKLAHIEKVRGKAEQKWWEGPS